MTDRLFILPLLFMALIASAANAQSSAQASMRVSVRVVSGVTATTGISSELQFDEAGVRGNLATVSLSGVDQDNVLISNESNISLTNEEGDQLDLPVGLNREKNTEKLILRFLTSDQKERSHRYKGRYSGTLNTTIEYL